MSTTNATRSSIHVAVLDMAGTTIDENGSVREAVLQALSETGGPTTDFDSTFAAMRGGAKTAMFDAFLPTRELSIAAHQRFEKSLKERIRAGAFEPLPGAEDAIRRLRRSGVKVALTTGFSSHVRDVLMQELGWDGLIDLVVSPDDAGRGRPHPDLVLTAAIRLAAPSVRSIAVVGDTTNDLLSGTRAGASIVVGVLTGAHRREKLEQAPHTHIVDSIADFPSIVEKEGNTA